MILGLETVGGFRQSGNFLIYGKNMATSFLIVGKDDFVISQSLMNILAREKGGNRLPPVSVLGSGLGITGILVDETLG